MICKECGAKIKNKEEYCRKCGSLVINFNKRENPTLKNVCIKNNLSGKFRNLISLFFNTDKKHHSFNKINKDRNLKDFHNMSSTKNSSSDDIDYIINFLKKFLK